MARIRTALAVCLLLASLLTLVPGASAHQCYATDPPSYCGECTSGLFDHDHRYYDGTAYCTSKNAYCVLGTVCVYPGYPGPFERN